MIVLWDKSDNTSDDTDEEIECSVDDVLDCAQQMNSVKKRIYQKAKDNIDSKQAKDKDRKHADPKVTNSCPVFIVHWILEFVHVSKVANARTLVKPFWRGRDVDISIVTPTKEICKEESEKNAESASLLPLSFALGPMWYLLWKSGPVWKMQEVVLSRMCKYPSGRFCRQLLCLVLP